MLGMDLSLVKLKGGIFVIIMETLVSNSHNLVKDNEKKGYYYIIAGFVVKSLFCITTNLKECDTKLLFYELLVLVLGLD